MIFRSIFIFVGLLISVTCFANPIVINNIYDFHWLSGVLHKHPIWLAVFVAIVAFPAEYYVIKILLRRNAIKIEGFWKKFFFIHCISFPLTQFIALYAGYISELFPVIVEKLFYNRNASFKDSLKKGWIIVILGNLTSWLIGFVIFKGYIL